MAQPKDDVQRQRCADRLLGSDRGAFGLTASLLGGAAGSVLVSQLYPFRALGDETT